MIFDANGYSLYGVYSVFGGLNQGFMYSSAGASSTPSGGGAATDFVGVSTFTGSRVGSGFVGV